MGRDPHRSAARQIPRRTVLAALLVATGCAPRRAEPPAPPVSVSTLLDTRPFYAAHRGGGGDWPEMTAYAYEQASRVPGLISLEVSVCLSADGVLVCSHDPTTKRLTGSPYVIAKTPWSTLSTLQVSAKETVDPRQPARPLTRFEEVLERYRDSHVLFVEPKVGRAVEPLMAALRGAPADRVVWKQPINSGSFAAAKRQGFATWGYVLNEPAHLGSNLTRYAASEDVDLLGAPLAEDDRFVNSVALAAQANSKQTMAWPVRSVSDLRRAQSLGVNGMMTSNPVELLGPPR